MKKKYLRYGGVLILVVAAFVSGMLIREKQIQDLLAVQNDNALSEEAIVNEWTTETNDVLYKLFYGKWEITSVIEGGPNYDESKVDEYIGRVVEYTADNIKVDGEEVLTAPAYAYGILPRESSWKFARAYEPRDTWFFEVNEGYFVYVWVETWIRDDYEGENEKVFKNFYIVDDNTLILDATDGYYVMERLEYMENYEHLESYLDYMW